MVINCQILIQKPRTGVYYPGQVVSGSVKYIIDEPTEFKDIVISLFGKGKCHWSETRRRNGSTKTTHYTGTEEYFDYRSSLLDKKGPTTLVDAGIYEHGFEFLLPDRIPSTYKDYNCDIIYSLKLKFYKPGFFSSDKRYTAEIIVKEYVDIDNENALIFGLEKKLTNIFSSKNNIIKVTGQVNKRLFSPGEEVNIVYKATNDSNIIIPAIKIELVAYKVYTANCGKKKYSREIIKECTAKSPSIPDNGIANLSNTITLPDNLYSLQNTKIFSLEYKLQITVKLQFPHFNTSIEAPIVIGYKFVGEDFEIPHDNPPSYWEAMQEDSEKYDEATSSK